MSKSGFPYHNGKRIMSAVDLLNIPENERTEEERQIIERLKEDAKPFQDAIEKQVKRLLHTRKGVSR